KGLRRRISSSRGKNAVRALVIVQGQADLVKVVGALGPSGGLPHFLHRRQQQGNQHADDGDDHQQFYQSKTLAQLGRRVHVSISSERLKPEYYEIVMLRE